MSQDQISLELIRLHDFLKWCFGKTNMQSEIDWAKSRIEFLEQNAYLDHIKELSAEVERLKHLKSYPSVIKPQNPEENSQNITDRYELCAKIERLKSELFEQKREWDKLSEATHAQRVMREKFEKELATVSATCLALYEVLDKVKTEIHDEHCDEDWHCNWCEQLIFADTAHAQIIDKLIEETKE